jgi:hypothetical protein
LLNVPGFGKLGVNVMLRTGLFPHARARLRNTTPSPQAVFRILAESFRRGCLSKRWQLPTLEEALFFFASVGSESSFVAPEAFLQEASASGHQTVPLANAPSASVEKPLVKRPAAVKGIAKAPLSGAKKRRTCAPQTRGAK